MAIIIKTAPSKALYSRCLIYRLREKPAVRLSPDQRGKNRGTRRAYDSKSGNAVLRNASSLPITGTYIAVNIASRKIQIQRLRAAKANPTPMSNEPRYRG